jgi:PadR family transcriptional regulator, regulatory protein AphA
MASTEAAALSEVEVALLGLVSIRPMYGYEIGHHFDRALAPFWSVPRTQIYPKLRELDERGLVDSRHVPQEARPNRRVYEITDEGSERLRDWVRGPMRWPDLKHPMMAKIFLGHLLPPEEVLGLLSDYRDRAAQWRDQLWEIHSKFEPSLKGSYGRSAFFQLVSLEHLIALAELELSGAERAIEAIEDARRTLERGDGEGSDELINIVREHLTPNRGGGT